MADRVIVVEKRRGCGCTPYLLTIFATLAIGLYIYNQPSPSAGSAEPDDPNAPRPFPEEFPGAYIISTVFEKSMDGYLLDPDSYKPNGSPRSINHPKGRAYFQDFTARNALGGPVRQIAGLLFHTNKTEETWTFYSPETVSELLDECKIKGAK